MPGDRGKLEFKRGFGVYGCFALPFLLIGPMVWYLAWIHAPHTDESFFGGVVFGLALPFLVGLAFVFGPLWVLTPEWVRVDALGFEHGSGLFRPWSMHRTPASELSRVAVIEDRKASRRQRYAVVAEGAGSRFALTTFSDADEAERLAQQVGALAGLPVERIQPPLGPPAGARAETPETLLGPSPDPITVSETAEGLDLRPPTPGLVGLQLIPIGFGLGFAAVGLFAVVIPFAVRGFGGGAPDELVGFYYLILGLMTLILVAAPAALIAGPFLLAAAVSIRITVFSGGLRVRRQVLGFSRDEIVSNDRIQRVEVWKSLGKPAGIEIAGDGVSLKLRAGMRESELTALRDQIRRRVGIRP
jgi:hypothetical protein